MAKYPYIVKFNGVWYNAGEDVPETESVAVDESPLPFSYDETNTDEQKKAYTKTDINKMSTADLQNLAERVGMENAYETNGGELKKMLIEYFRL